MARQWLGGEEKEGRRKKREEGKREESGTAGHKIRVIFQFIHFPLFDASKHGPRQSPKRKGATSWRKGRNDHRRRRGRKRGRRSASTLYFANLEEQHKSARDKGGRKKGEKKNKKGEVSKPLSLSSSSHLISFNVTGFLSQ